MRLDSYLRIGVDIENVSNFKRALSKGKRNFIQRIFTPKEIIYCSGKAAPHEHLAARFAAKEAVIKAVGDICPISFSQIEISNDRRGRPLVNLLNCDTQQLKGDCLALSLSHSKGYAIAFVIYANLPKKERKRLLRRIGYARTTKR